MVEPEEELVAAWYVSACRYDKVVSREHAQCQECCSLGLHVISISIVFT